MGEVIKKVGDETPKTLFGLHVFLSAYLAKRAFHGGPTIQAISFLPFRFVRHRRFLIKIRTNVGLGI